MSFAVYPFFGHLFVVAKNKDKEANKEKAGDKLSTDKIEIDIKKVGNGYEIYATGYFEVEDSNGDSVSISDEYNITEVDKLKANVVFLVNVPSDY